MAAAQIFTRRSLLSGAMSTSLGLAINVSRGQIAPQVPQPDPKCLRCRGVGLVPRSDQKGYVFLEGGSPFKPELASAGDLCPICRPLTTKEALIDLEEANHAALLAEHKQWEERTGWKFLLVQTRHAAIHTLLKATEATKVGQALESLALHLQKVSGDLRWVPTRPNTWGLVLLWEKETWTKFRTVMQSLFEPAELGEDWGLARDYNSYDHLSVPHMYETSQTLRQRPPSYGAVCLLARRQMDLLARGKSHQLSNWLVEGFACYAQQATLGDVRWFSVYEPSRAPPIGNWQQEVRRLAVDSKLLPWKEMLARHLRDFTPADYRQSLGMVAFLLHSEPAKFLVFCRSLQEGSDCQTALEDSLGKSLGELETQAQRWLQQWR